MPPKKQAQLQAPLETQDEWNDFISKDGLSVVDVYSAWCGPCKAVQGLFRRLKNELGDELLRFALAKSDTIGFLEPYREKSMPTFLMFAGGVLVSVIRGALGPLLEKTIKEQLSYEHEVLEGKKERVPIVDEVLSLPVVELEEEVEEEEENQRPVPTHKQFTVMVIKPDAVQAGKVDEILERVKSEGVDVLASEEHLFTKEEAAEFYKQHEGSEHFDELVEFICSGPCMTLVLTKGDTGEDVVDEMRKIIGPKDVEEAKEQAPESIRATFGTDIKKNAVHASDSHEVAARELAFFMPKFRLPYVPGTEPPIERTLALIRPNALAKHRGSIIEKIREAGFEIAYEKELVLTKEQAEEFYKEHQDKEFYDTLTTHMSSGPLMALCLAREDAVAEWRKMLTSAPSEETDEEEQAENLRVEFAEEGSDINPLHGSDAVETAAKEVDFFFPTQHTFCAIKPHLMESHRESIMAKIKESGFNISMTQETVLTREMAEQLYANQTDKEYFDDLVSMMTTGPSLFMVLSKPDAVLGWRSLMGPTDPDMAKQANPNSLRALYGNSPLENALHGSSDQDHALREIEQVFGPVTLLPDGTVLKEGEEAEEEVKDGGTKADGEDGGRKEEEGAKEEGGVVKSDSGAKSDAEKEDPAKSEQVKSEVKSEEAKSEEAKEDKVKSEEAKSDEAKSDTAKENEAKSEDAKSDEAKSDTAKEDEAKSDAAKEGDAKSEEAKSEEAKSDEAKSEEAKSEEAKSEETKSDAAKEDSGSTTKEGPAEDEDKAPETN